MFFKCPQLVATEFTIVRDRAMIEFRAPCSDSMNVGFTLYSCICVDLPFLEQINR